MLVLLLLWRRIKLNSSSSSKHAMLPARTPFPSCRLAGAAAPQQARPRVTRGLVWPRHSVVCGTCCALLIGPNRYVVGGLLPQLQICCDTLPISAATSPRLTASHSNSEVKRGRVQVVLRWGTTREGWMLYFCNFPCFLTKAVVGLNYHDILAGEVIGKFGLVV